MNDDGSYQFVDTNVLVYAYDSSQGQKQTQARQLLHQLWQQRWAASAFRFCKNFM